MSARFRLLAAIAGATLVLCACGDEDKAASSPSPAAPPPDPGFVAAMLGQNASGLEIAQLAVDEVADRRINRFARVVLAQRKREQKRYSDLERRVGEVEGLGSFKPPPDAIIEPLTREGLENARPLKFAFIVSLIRLDRAALALAKAEKKQGKDPAVLAAADRTAAERGKELAVAEKFTR